MAEKTKLDANYTVKKSMGMGTIRVIAYVVLVLLSLMWPCIRMVPGLQAVRLLCPP